MSVHDARGIPSVLMASPPEDQWFCVTCLSIRANKIKWGPAEGESAIKATISSIYEEIITWRKNLFIIMYLIK